MLLKLKLLFRRGKKRTEVALTIRFKPFQGPRRGSDPPPRF